MSNRMFLAILLLVCLGFTGCKKVGVGNASGLEITINAPETISTNGGRGTVIFRNSTGNKIDLYYEVSCMLDGKPGSLSEGPLSLSSKESKEIVFGIYAKKGYNNIRVEAKWGDKKVTANRSFKVE
jgi:hypothetical protein